MFQHLSRSIYFLLLIPFILTSCSHEEATPPLQGYLEGQYIYLSSSVPGVLNSLFVQRGDRVKPNEMIFLLDPQPELAALKAAEANLRREKESLQNIMLDGQRKTLNALVDARNQAISDLNNLEQKLILNQKRYHDKAISKDELDKTTADYNAKKKWVEQTVFNLSKANLGSRKHLLLAQQAAIDMATANVTQKMWQLKQTKIRAPQAGVISDVFFKVGEFVPAGQPVAAVLASNQMKLVFYVPETLLSQLQTGTIITFHCDGCDRQDAKITYISDQPEYTPPIIYNRKNRSQLVYRVECTLTEKEIMNLHPGQPVDIYLQSEIKPKENGAITANKLLHFLYA